MYEEDQPVLMNPLQYVARWLSEDEVQSSRLLELGGLLRRGWQRFAAGNLVAATARCTCRA